MSKEEGNRLIAEFMGWESNLYPNLPNRLHRTDEKDVQWSTDIGNLMYHYSWDWLMPAWGKFRSMEVMKFDMVSKNAWNNHCEFIGNAIIHAPIEIAFERLVKAINWYIQNKKEA